MFSKLALRNVRRSFRDYGVYLLTLTFGVCLFYTFNSIDGQGAMVYLAQNQNPMVEPILMLIDIFSVFVAVVLACLILYANRFLLRRRKRELGTYLLLGRSYMPTASSSGGGSGSWAPISCWACPKGRFQDCSFWRPELSGSSP